MTSLSRLSRRRRTLAAPAVLTAPLTATLVPGLAQLPAIADDGATPAAAPSGHSVVSPADTWLARPEIGRASCRERVYVLV